MINQILMVFMGVFAVIGIMTALYAATESIGRTRRKHAVAAEVVLFVSAADRESIEGAVREYASRLCSGMCGIRARALSVVISDNGETREYFETREILSKLEQDISIIKVYTESDYIKHIKSGA